MAGDDPADTPRFDASSDEFVSECGEHLSAARDGLLRLESLSDQPIDRATVDELFRNFHTLKGLAGMVGLGQAELLAHQMESYLDALRNARVHVTTEAIDTLVDGIASLETIIASHCSGEKPRDIANLLSRLSVLGQPLATPKESLARVAPSPDADKQVLIGAALRAGRRLWLIRFRPSPLLAERGVNVNSIRQRLVALGEVIHAAPQILPDSQIEFEFVLGSQAEPSVFDAWKPDGVTYAPYEGPAPEHIPPAVDAAPAGDVAKGGVASNAIRVDLAKLDDVMRMVGELVITRARFEECLKQMKQVLPARPWRELQESNLAFERQIRNLREGVVRVRLVPIRGIFSRMQFVVRDLARESGKTVVLHLSGQDTEVDKLVVERMMDPLLHLVRNAISHGVEPASDRLRLGKPEAASIQLRAMAVGEMIVIEVEDDGRGINVEDVAQRARAGGLLDSAAALNDATLLDTICLPHFSTRDEADLASGRGVGMSIVRSAVEQLGGSLSVDTQVGRGTCFRLQLPLTLAIADALIVRVGGQRLAVPQSAVREVIPLEPADITILENNEVVSHRDNVVPLVRLGNLFQWPAEANARTCALIIGEGRKAVGIVVDRVLGLHEVVVRPLTDSLVRVPGISGATELGDGHVVLILDAAAATRFARGRIDRKRSGFAEPLGHQVSERGGVK